MYCTVLATYSIYFRVAYFDSSLVLPLTCLLSTIPMLSLVSHELTLWTWCCCPLCSIIFALYVIPFFSESHSTSQKLNIPSSLAYIHSSTSINFTPMTRCCLCIKEVDCLRLVDNLVTSPLKSHSMLSFHLSTNANTFFHPPTYNLFLVKTGVPR